MADMFPVLRVLGILVMVFALAMGLPLGVAPSLPPELRDQLLAFLDLWGQPAELLALVDYERREPAIDTGYFDCGDDWYWTDTPLHGSPSDVAWIVLFSSGDSRWVHRSSEGLVRAVRRSQSFGLLARAA